MKPSPKKFRIRRGSAANPQQRQQRAAAKAAPAAGTPDGNVEQQRPAPSAAPAAPAPNQASARKQAGARPQQTAPLERMAAEHSAPGHEADEDISPRDEIQQIKSENLTGRQLRIARRLAQRSGLNPTSDLDAVRLLRKKGIDPFAPKEMMGMKQTRQGAPASQEIGQIDPKQLPATLRQAQVPAPITIDDATREIEIAKIQRNLIKRRRRRLGLLLAKLLFFVALPSLIAGFYFYSVATPMYATHSQFLIQKADPAGGGPASGLLSGTGFANSTDSIAVQSYLTSRDAMARLDATEGFKTHFQNPEIDRLQRLDADASNESAYRVYQKRVQIGFDPTEGIIKMEVVASSPEASQRFSNALVDYAEEQVDQLTQRLREDQMLGARKAYDQAELKWEEAQNSVVALQEQLGVLDGGGEAGMIMGQINTYELDLQTRKLDLAELLDNPRPNKTKVEVQENAIKRREALISQLRGQLTDGTDVTDSLAKVTSELAAAQSRVLVRQELLAQSLIQLEAARIEANRQTRYLSIGVSPIAPDEATYPKAFENTLLSVIVFGGLFLLISLTLSILREQVSS